MIRYDLHVHTPLSACGSKTDGAPAVYLQRAEEAGLTLVGFSDHSWDFAVPGVPPFYKEQPYERLPARRGMIPDDTGGIRVLLGAEGEYTRGVLGITEDAKKYTDYILAPHSHMDVNGLHEPDSSAGDAAFAALADAMLQSLYSLCTHPQRGLFFGVVHPMYPTGYRPESMERVYAHIRDEALDKVCSAARENGVFLELNLSSFRHWTPEQARTCCYARFFEAVKRTGCDLFLGSDSHDTHTFAARHASREALLAALGLDAARFTAAERRIRRA